MYSESEFYLKALESLNGNIVALCHFPEECFEAMQVSTQDASNESFETRKILQMGSKFSNEFYGYGIVVQIDEETSEIHLITPLSLDVLEEKVNCIVSASELELPSDLVHPSQRKNSSHHQHQNPGNGNPGRRRRNRPRRRHRGRGHGRGEQN